MEDDDIIDAKIEALRHCLARIKEKTPASADDLLENYDLQDIISVNLERAVQVCVDLGAHIIAGLDSPIPTTMADTFDKLAAAAVIKDSTARNLKRAVGFRNISVHEYQQIDWQVVYRIVTSQLGDFCDFMRQIENWRATEGES